MTWYDPKLGERDTHDTNLEDGDGFCPDCRRRICRCAEMIDHVSEPAKNPEAKS